jgi:hypothetical protein
LSRISQIKAYLQFRTGKRCQMKLNDVSELRSQSSEPLRRYTLEQS